MDEATKTRIIELVDRKTAALAAVNGREVRPRPVCRVLLVDATEVEHAREMGDDEHGVMLVMES